jgi:FAD/FMN-containing dehydrogenase
MSATNSSGARTLRYGSMRPWVQALDCVFADGTRAEVRRGTPPPDLPIVAGIVRGLDALLAAERAAPSRHPGVRKESSGYGLAAYAESGELVDLIVGSEGTLVLVVGLELRLTPVLPFSASLLGAFDTIERAVGAAGAAREAGASACELLDRTFLDVAREGGANVPVPERAESVLLAEVEAESREGADALAGEIERRFREAGAIEVAIALDSDTSAVLWELRHAASPILSRLDPSLKSMQFIEDGCVPPARLPEYVRGVRAALDGQAIRGVIFGHAGDAHVHVNPLVDVRLSDWRARVDALLEEVTSLTVRLGGTLSGEHGDGRLRAPLLDRLWSAESLARFAAVKRAFDPGGLLNPGAKLATPGSRAVDRVKYDPSLPALPPAARAALTTVERERAYARFRLSMLDDFAR